MDCTDCIELLHGFLDGELSPESSDSVQEHLDGCASCFKRSQVEEAFRRAIRERAARIPVPEGLDERIRRALDAEDGGDARAEAPGAGRPWSRNRRWGGFGLAAAAALAAALVLFPRHGASPEPQPASGGPATGPAWSSGAAPIANPVQVSGRLVCLGCLLLNQQTADASGRVLLPGDAGVLDDTGLHDRLLFLSDAGGMWELAPSRETSGLIRDHENRDRPVTLVGTAMPQYSTIQVARLKFL